MHPTGGERAEEPDNIATSVMSDYRRSRAKLWHARDATQASVDNSTKNKNLKEDRSCVQIGSRPRVQPRH